jgi:hypothetical protein
VQDQDGAVSVLRASRTHRAEQKSLESAMSSAPQHELLCAALAGEPWVASVASESSGAAILGTILAEA